MLIIRLNLLYEGRFPLIFLLIFFSVLISLLGSFFLSETDEELRQMLHFVDLIFDPFYVLSYNETKLIELSFKC